MPKAFRLQKLDPIKPKDWIFSVKESKPYFRRKASNEHPFPVISAVWKGNKNNSKRTILKELVGVIMRRARLLNCKNKYNSGENDAV